MTTTNNSIINNVGNNEYMDIILPIILTFCPIYIFSMSLKEINKISLSPNSVLKRDLLILNGSVLTLSGLTYIYSINKLINFRN